MLASREHLRKRTGRFGTPRFDYLQQLVTEFQSTTIQADRAQILANLGNFAYDPINYEAFRKLNIVELFVDMLTDEPEDLKELAIAGLCNCCIDPKNAQIIVEAEGIAAVVDCLTNENESEEVALSSMSVLQWLLNPSTHKEIVTEQVKAALAKYTVHVNPRIKNVALLLAEKIG
eukprot:GILJ01005871.1.p1 GENE.GILJ01005871.1~~GILJ01005871.1.p1  ORF type:complete len:175 (-),score=29.21 GILJ01005871.1:549-1073(-)